MPALTHPTTAIAPPTAPPDPSVLPARTAPRTSSRQSREIPRSFRILTGDRADRRAASGPLLRLPAEQGPAAGRRGRTVGPDRRLSGHHRPDRTADLPDIVIGLVADYLALGIDPERSTIFAHSQVEPLNQLLLPFLSLVSVAEIGRNPTVKDEIAATGSATVSGLMFTYPVHQAADILFCHANLVPVGSDQLPHIELTRTIARRFNERYCPDAPYFPDARRPAQHRPAAARNRRPEDEQEPEQLGPAARHARRDRAIGVDGRRRIRSATSATSRNGGPR